MRVVASGIWLYKKLNTELIIIWNENYEVNCPYNLLFEGTEELVIKKKNRKYIYVKTSNQNSFSKRLLTQVTNKLAGIDYCLQDEDFSTLIWSENFDIAEVVSKYKITYIQTCQEFGNNAFAFRYFKPVLSISKKINVITKDFNEFTIGVHIRRGDNIDSILNSPLDLFVEKMNLEVNIEKNTSFYLSTDDLEVEKKITAVFGKRIITYKKELSRQTVKGMQDAVVDLYCLSMTTKILGSYWSSFSQIASRLNKIELEILTTEK